MPVLLLSPLAAAGWLAFPAAARVHARQADRAVVDGSALELVETAMDATLTAMRESNVEDLEDSMLDFYKLLLRQSRWREGGSASPAILEHLLRQDDLQADATIGHLASSDLVWRKDLRGALDLLRSLRMERVPLSVGSFDHVMQVAGKARERSTVYAAYRELRRSRLVPTAYTLNALLNAETRCGRPAQAIAILRRASRGAPRWPGDAPDTWCFTTGMAAAKRARQYETVGRLFSKVTREPRLRERVGLVAYNLAVEARVRQGDKDGARAILARMKRGENGAPPPRTDTFNALILACGERGESYKWVLSEMSACQVPPDAYTVCTMIKLQPSVNSARGVWRWGRRLGAANSFKAWTHLIEAHIRHGQPYRVEALLQLMESRDGLRADSAYAHNLYLRALTADGKPDKAIAHFERMCGGEGGEGGANDDADDEKRAAWLARTPPAPDKFSYSIALTALRSVGEESAPPTRAAAASSSRGGGRGGEKTAGRALEIIQSAEARGIWDADGQAPLPAPVAHALVSACGDDVDGAIALWRGFLRPRFLADRGETPPTFNPIGAQPTAEQAALHAVMRVCGAARRADEALKVVYAMKRDGCALDASFHTAYLNGREGAEGAGKSKGGLLQSSYETLLALELDPEQVSGPRLGKIEKIRIQF